MRLKHLVWLCISLIAATTLSACNLSTSASPTVDVNAIYTEAAQTALAGFSAQLTQTAQAMPPTAIPTNTPLATFTLLPTFPPAAGVTPLASGTLGVGTPLVISSPIPTTSGPLCNDSKFIADVTVEDGTVLKPHEDFEKIWRLQNSGTCAWDEGYAFVFVAGENMGGGNIVLSDNSNKYFTKPGETVDFGVWLDVGDAGEGEHTGCWKMKDDKGYYFGTIACYTIVVSKK